MRSRELQNQQPEISTLVLVITATGLECRTDLDRKLPKKPISRAIGTSFQDASVHERHESRNTVVGTIDELCSSESAWKNLHRKSLG